eukprot:Sspe_Gene.110809::Locus_91883_Transcript_1_1_Confidence_1.000_Length_568::g.110809::m.110809
MKTEKKRSMTPVRDLETSEKEVPLYFTVVNATSILVAAASSKKARASGSTTSSTATPTVTYMMMDDGDQYPPNVPFQRPSCLLDTHSLFVPSLPPPPPPHP